MATPRSLVVVDGEVAAYHCMARCVRRAALCGDDPLTGRNHDHRKSWLQNRLQQLAAAFAFDIGSYAIMSNHLHVVLKSRPDLTRLWDADEIWRRWRAIFPLRNKPKAVLQAIHDEEVADKKLTAKRRARLASVSWFMRCLLEPTARRANAEDNCSGRFWEERFKCVGLLDDTSVLACSAYVDLNPVRAGIAATPEASSFTSIFDRIQQFREPQSESAAADNWLSPITNKDRKTKTSRRVSNTAWLDMTLVEYLELLDWTGRQIRDDKRGAIDSSLPPILDRLKLPAAGWLRLVKDFGRLFKRHAGRPESLTARAESQHRKSVHGITAAREIFG